MQLPEAVGTTVIARSHGDVAISAVFYRETRDTEDNG